jgi:hypothetical protein
MARPGLEPVRTASPVTGMDASTASDGETRTRTGDTTIFRESRVARDCSQKTCKSQYPYSVDPGAMPSVSLG